MNANHLNVVESQYSVDRCYQDTRRSPAVLDASSSPHSTISSSPPSSPVHRPSGSVPEDILKSGSLHLSGSTADATLIRHHRACLPAGGISAEFDRATYWSRLLSWIDFGWFVDYTSATSYQ